MTFRSQPDGRQIWDYCLQRGNWGIGRGPAIWVVYYNFSKAVTKSETLSPSVAHALDPGQTRYPLVGGYKPWPPGCVDPQGWPKHAELDRGVTSSEDESLWGQRGKEEVLRHSKSICLQCGRPGFDHWVGKIP